MTKAITGDGWNLDEGLAAQYAAQAGLDPHIAAKAGNAAWDVLKSLRDAVEESDPARRAKRARRAQNLLAKANLGRHRDLVSAIQKRLAELAGEGAGPSVNPETGLQEFFSPLGSRQKSKDLTNRLNSELDDKIRPPVLDGVRWGDYSLTQLNESPVLPPVPTVTHKLETDKVHLDRARFHEPQPTEQTDFQATEVDPTVSDAPDLSAPELNDAFAINPKWAGASDPNVSSMLSLLARPENLSDDDFAKLSDKAVAMYRDGSIDRRMLGRLNYTIESQKTGPNNYPMTWTDAELADRYRTEAGMQDGTNAFLGLAAGAASSVPAPPVAKGLAYLGSLPVGWVVNKAMDRQKNLLSRELVRRKLWDSKNWRPKDNEP